MNGFIAEKKGQNGESFWVVRDVNTKAVMAVGNTVTQAVENYEIIVANESMKAKLGFDVEDMSI